MKASTIGLVLLWSANLALAAYAACPAEPPLPSVKQVWLPEMPLLGPKLAAYQDPGHRMREQDPESYCFNPETSGSQAKQRERDPHAHRCFCHLQCQIGAAGEVSGEHEDATCAHYCVREACNCHVEDPCEMPNAH